MNTPSNSVADRGDYQWLDPRTIAPARFQPRAADRAQDFARLRQSVEATGRRDISTVQVERVEPAVEYEGRLCDYRLLDGEGRWREALAARLLDESVLLPAHLISGLDDAGRARIALFANEHRRLRPIELARGVEQLVKLEVQAETERRGVSLSRREREQLGRQVLQDIGVSSHEWKRTKKLLRLPPELQERLLGAGLPRQTQLALTRLPADLATYFLDAIMLPDVPKYTAQGVRVAVEASSIVQAEDCDLVYKLTDPTQCAVLLRYAAAAALQDGGLATKVAYAVEDYFAYQRAFWHRRHRPKIAGQLDDDEPQSMDEQQQAEDDPAWANRIVRGQLEADQQPEAEDSTLANDLPLTDHERGNAATRVDREGAAESSVSRLAPPSGDKSPDIGLAAEVATMREQLARRRRELAALDDGGRKALRCELAGVALLVESMIAECG